MKYYVFKVTAGSIYILASSYYIAESIVRETEIHTYGCEEEIEQAEFEAAYPYTEKSRLFGRLAMKGINIETVPV